MYTSRICISPSDFQAVEAAWRAVHFLVWRLGTDTELKLYLLDISKAELAADLTATEGLPLHVYRDQGESKIKPCADVVLTEQAAEIILDNDLMPLLSFRNQDSVRLARFQSLADPLTHLAGRWG